MGHTSLYMKEKKASNLQLRQMFEQIRNDFRHQSRLGADVGLREEVELAKKLAAAHCKRKNFFGLVRFSGLRTCLSH